MRLNNLSVFIVCVQTVLTQDEWNEKQRAERKSEFSWSYDGSTARRSASPDRQQNVDSDDDDDDLVGPSLDMFMAPPDNPNKQSTITSKSFFKRPIHNELLDDDGPSPATQNEPSGYGDDSLDSIPLPSEPKRGTEIAPPPTYEYYGPSGRQGPNSQKHCVTAEDMQDSISKGLTSANTKRQPRQVRGIVDDQ